MKIKAAFTTAIGFYALETAYVPGEGVSKMWTPIYSSPLPTEQVKLFACEWVNTYGTNKLTAQSQGISESARVRMPFVPNLYEKLGSVSVLIAKNGDPNVLKDGQPNLSCPNAYMVWGGVDNIREANQFMAFDVRRFEVI